LGQFESFQEYDRFTRDWLTAARRAERQRHHLGDRLLSQHLRVGSPCRIWLLDSHDVVWRKTNPMPNFKGAASQCA